MHTFSTPGYTISFLAFFKSVPLVEKLSFCSDCMLDDVDMKTHWRRTYCDLAKIACFEGICAGFATFSSLTGQSGRWEHCSNIMRNYCTIALIKIKFYLWIRMQRIAKAFQHPVPSRNFWTRESQIPNESRITGDDHDDGDVTVMIMMTCVWKRGTAWSWQVAKLQRQRRSRLLYSAHSQLCDRTIPS